MQEQRVAFPQRVNEMLRTLQCEANQVDDDIRTESCNGVSESARGFLCGAVDRQPLYFSPRGMRLIGLTSPATRSDYLVSGRDEPRDQKGADVTGGADDDDSNG